MIVVRKWPAWNSLAMLGEENSTMIFFGLLFGAKASEELAERFEPYLLPRSRIYGMANWGKRLWPKLN